MLGVYLREGRLGEPDPVKAQAAFARACKTGHKPACTQIDAPTDAPGGEKL